MRDFSKAYNDIDNVVGFLYNIEFCKLSKTEKESFCNLILISSKDIFIVI